MSGLVVHANTDEHFYAFEVETSVFSLFRKFAEVVDKSVSRLEVVDLIFLWSIVVDDFGAVRGGNARKVLAKGGSTVCDDESFVEAGTAEDVDGLEGILYFLLHLRLLLLNKKISRGSFQT